MTTAKHPALGAAPAPRAQIVPLRRGSEELSDEALLAACGVGDAPALGALYDRHHGAMFRLVSRLLRAEPAEVDDLVQLTFMGAWKNAKSYRGPSSVRSFLFGIAANVVRQHVRSSRRRRDAYAALEPFAPVATGRPDVEVARARDMTRLARALDELPHDLRAAYVMCELEEMPGPDAARILDVRIGTLWRRLHDARKALREALSDGDHP